MPIFCFSGTKIHFLSTTPFQLYDNRVKWRSSLNYLCVTIGKLKVAVGASTFTTCGLE